MILNKKVYLRITRSIAGSMVLLLFFTGCKTEKKEVKDSNENQTVVVSDSLPWSERMALSIMERDPKAWQTENDSIPKWNYKIGLLCTAFQQLYKRTLDERFLNYVKDYTDVIINDEGVITGYNLEEYNIDMINSGKMLFWLYDETQDPKYHKALIKLRKQLDGHPRTDSHGFWHKKIYPYQMWLDGLYMGTPFYAEYNTRFENGDKLDDIAHQFELIWKHTFDEETGLLYHAWDESKQMDWANKENGKSPNFWSRSMGWYVMALVDVLDFFPAEHPKREVLVEQLNRLSEALLEHQDETGLWYQVPNMPEKEGNYLESSGSSMFAYGFAKGTSKGYLPEEYLAHAEKIFNGLVEHLIKVDANGEVHITQVCKSAGLGGNPYRDGSFEYYISEPIVTDNLHGLGPFILAANQLNK